MITKPNTAQQAAAIIARAVLRDLRWHTVKTIRTNGMSDELVATLVNLFRSNGCTVDQYDDFMTVARGADHLERKEWDIPSEWLTA